VVTAGPEQPNRLSHVNIAGLVRERAHSAADTEVYRFMWSGAEGAAPIRLTYRTLDRAARRIAGRLRSAGQRRTLIVQSTGQRFAESLFGCWYSGAVAIPAPPVGGRHHTERLLAIIKDAQVDAVLTDSTSAPELSRLLASAGHTSGVECLAVDAFEPAEADDWRPVPSGGEDLALLQYTSGSTGAPRGVPVTHAQLLANQAAITRAFGTGPSSIIGGWLPLHHDMGLVGHLLQPIFVGATGVLMSPWTFLRSPVRWLELISECGVTASAAPNFAYDLVARQVTDEQIARLDLSHWDTAVVGAEPIRADTLRGFAERFAPAGFRAAALRPAYGLAEATLLVSASGPLGYRERQADPAALEQGLWAEPAPCGPAQPLVGSGAPVDTEVRVVHPTSGQALPSGQVGEIWVRGEGVADGYWRAPLETRRCFGVTSADGAGGFLRTGDLGVLRDGELYVTGRLKDLLIIDGRNLHPHDVEHAVHAVSPLCGAGAVFGVLSDREHMVVVQEISARRGTELDFDRLDAAVQDRLAEDFSVSSSMVLVRPGTIRRTTSGKIQRDRVRQLFLSGRLDPLHERLATPVRELLRRMRIEGAGRGLGNPLSLG
jgi:acyl-CoA synthetase (AMP-forming)/AMP-acid ligase II